MEMCIRGIGGSLRGLTTPKGSSRLASCTRQQAASGVEVGTVSNSERKGRSIQIKKMSSLDKQLEKRNNGFLLTTGSKRSNLKRERQTRMDVGCIKSYELL